MNWWIRGFIFLISWTGKICPDLKCQRYGWNIMKYIGINELNSKSDLFDNLWLMLPLDFLVSTESKTIKVLSWRIYFDPKSFCSVYTQHSSEHWTANWLKEIIYTLILETELKKATVDSGKKQGFLFWCYFSEDIINHYLTTFELLNSSQITRSWLDFHIFPSLQSQIFIHQL